MKGIPLSSPIQLGSLHVRNRNWMGALTRNRCLPKDVPNAMNAEYYAQRAKGGAGLIVSEAALIRRQGCLHSNSPGLWSDEHVAGWKKVNDAVHAHGSAMFAQLWHMGRVAHPDMPEQKAAGIPVYGPSAIQARGGRFRELPGEPGYVIPTAIEDPTALIREYRHSAEQAKKAGFDGVELHGANGYLVHQFLDSTSNIRTDEWGGSVKNRIRFIILILKELIQVFGTGRVGVKLSPGGGYNDMGMPLDETLATFSAVIKEAVKLKIGYITLVRITPGTPFLKPEHPNPGTYHDVLAAYGSLIKRKGSSTLLVLNQDLTVDEGNELIRQDKIDVAMYGRHWINNPDFQRRIEQGVALATEMDTQSWYNIKGHPSKGYSDYPTAT